MNIFKESEDTKRMIFNVRHDLADRLLAAKEEARNLGKRLDIDMAINRAIEKFLAKADKRIREEKKKQKTFLQLMEKSTYENRDYDPENLHIEDESSCKHTNP